MGIKNINRDYVALVILLIVLLFCNLTFPISTGWARLGLNIAGYIGLLGCYLYAKLNLADIGLSKTNLKSGFKWSSYTVLFITAVFFIIFLIDKQAFKDPRYHHDFATVFYTSIVLLPLKTVIFEELAFRGIGLALLIKIKNSRWFANIISSLAFGIWHVSSSISINNYNLGGGIIIPKFLVVLVAVLATTTAGLILCELRWRSKSLVTPIITHWYVNSFAMLLASISWR